MKEVDTLSTSFQTPVVRHLSVLSARDARQRNESAYGVTVAHHGLPSQHVAVQATEASVLVSATDMNVIADWLFVMGGSVVVTELVSGQSVWTLRTSTWSDSARVPVVPVFVSVVQPTGEPVMCEIAGAVAR